MVGFVTDKAFLTLNSFKRILEYIKTVFSNPHKNLSVDWDKF